MKENKNLKILKYSFVLSSILFLVLGLFNKNKSIQVLIVIFAIIIIVFILDGFDILNRGVIKYD